MRLLIGTAVVLATGSLAAGQDRYGALESPPALQGFDSGFGESPAPAPAAGRRYGADAPAAPRNDFRQNPPSTRPAGPAASPRASLPPSLSPQAAVPPTRRAAASEANTIMRAMLAAPSGSRLSGSPITLGEVVAGAVDRKEQTRRIDAYWDLCSSVSDYYLGLREAEELRRLQRKLPTVSSALREAGRELQIRVGTSQKAAVATQQRLASLMGRSSLGLPGDLPYCGEYDTKFAEIFAGRAAPEARGLHELLPLRYAELRGAADAVSRSEAWVQSVARQPSQTGAGMIRALELLALNRRAFVQIARDYNRRITRYTELSRPGRIDNNRLVAMLIGRPAAGVAGGFDSRGDGTGVTFRSPLSSGTGRR